MIHRAKVYGEDRYVEGLLLPKFNENTYISTEWTSDFDGFTPNFIRVHENTLAVHMPDFIDSKGNKFFASLNKDGKGADILVGQGYVGKVWYGTKTEFYVEYVENYGFTLKDSSGKISDLHVWLDAEHKIKNPIPWKNNLGRHYCELEVNGIKE